MTEFDKSELYRKYIIGLQFVDVKLYTLWGTDMEDEDKLLVNNSNLI